MINNSRSLFNQQLGFGKWNNYDSTLQRLRCSKKEEIDGIWGSEETENGDIDTPTFACKFSKLPGTDHLLALANENGRLVLHDTNKKEKCYGKHVHLNAIFDVAWLSDAFKLITVSGDNTARLIDMKRNTMDIVKVFRGHTRSVKTVVGKPRDSSVFATGSHDGSIRVWDIRSGCTEGLLLLPDSVIQNSHSRTTPSSRSKKKALVNSVTGLVFYNDDTLISCGSGDGFIKIWDMRKTYNTALKHPLPRSTIPYSGHTTRNGFSSLVIDIERSKLYANCLDNTIYSYNIGTYNVNPIMEYRGHLNSSYYIKSALSQDGKYILSGSTDQNAYIWNVERKAPVVKLIGHTAEVTCVAWRQKGDLTLVTCSDDVKHKIWKIGPQILPDNWEIDGRGVAETIIHTPKTKRLLEMNENTPVSNKKMRTNSQKRSSDEILVGEIKRFHSGRRLFETSNNAPGPSKEDETLATILEEGNDLCKTPKASLLHKTLALISPENFSPTSNLPNFVVDGSAPHLHFSPQKQRDKDWLTKMRVENRLIREMKDLGSSGLASPKVPKFESKRKTPSRRKSNNSPQPPILKFFRVTNNSILNDSQCSPKSSIIH